MSVLVQGGNVVLAIGVCTSQSSSLACSLEAVRRKHNLREDALAESGNPFVSILSRRYRRAGRKSKQARHRLSSRMSRMSTYTPSVRVPLLTRKKRRGTVCELSVNDLGAPPRIYASALPILLVTRHGSRSASVACLRQQARDRDRRVRALSKLIRSRARCSSEVHVFSKAQKSEQSA
ncbi:hypothetical protein DFH11DRAFT_1543687 [Phellopilus nigrolimitatus]|nr:hypothetical protein DFH11DRAFT_1543687 [Phellopilus nigrolimitatus]